MNRKSPVSVRSRLRPATFISDGYRVLFLQEQGGCSLLCTAHHHHHHHHYHHHRHHISVMELGHLLTRSGLTYPKVSSKVCYFFCQLRNNVSLPWVIYYGAFYLHVQVKIGGGMPPHPPYAFTPSTETFFLYLFTNHKVFS